MAGSALTQSASSVLGIGHFNWTAVAAAGAGAMLGHSVGKGLHAAGLRQPLLSGTLKSMASGGAQSLVHGVRPNRGRIAAKPFDNNAGRQGFRCSPIEWRGNGGGLVMPDRTGASACSPAHAG
ncbi:hypothetical protein [Microvirgula aerodenitrificans]|uniref:hypothetical protein n=1 Tax=Microvirgula aerodenitrificans TaxID=57480 RepID=UPI0028ED3969|nr:hypothetical protein [Microvirgula aerodenitrificans]